MMRERQYTASSQNVLSCASLLSSVHGYITRTAAHLLYLGSVSPPTRRRANQGWEEAWGQKMKEKLVWIKMSHPGIFSSNNPCIISLEPTLTSLVAGYGRQRQSSACHSAESFREKPFRMQRPRFCACIENLNRVQFWAAVVLLAASKGKGCLP